MDNNITKALWLGVGVLFFIGVVTLGLNMFDKGKSAATEQSENLSELEKTLAESEYSMYDNETVTGADVISCIKKFREKSDVFAVKVSTKKGSITYLNSANLSGETVTLGLSYDKSRIEADIKEARTESSESYINPVASFDASLKKDSNGVISAVEFIQR